MKRLSVALVALSFSACFDFDKAYDAFCDGGRCSGGADASGGGMQADASIDSGVDSGAQDSGTADAGSGDSGAPDSGATDAGPSCGVWGSTCSGLGQCCATSDAGLPMTCGRSNYCLETPTDCKQGLAVCSGNSECCTNRCENGRCTVQGLGSSSQACLTGADCAAGYNCDATGHCANDATLGNQCNNSDSCESSSLWCDLRPDAGPHTGICTDTDGGLPGGGACGALRSPDTANCCPGLEAVTSGPMQGCRQSLGSWCYYNDSCASGYCRGWRCVANNTVPPGGRCTYSDDCGTGYFCDPTTAACVKRWCLPPGLNAYSGCCNLTISGLCVFADNTSCVIGNVTETNSARCCSGAIDTGRCTSTYLFQ